MIAVAAALLGAAAAPASAARIKGLDVSSFQGNMNWSTARAQGVDFAFVRATRGGTTSATGKSDDAELVDNAPVAKAAGILTGVYHYGRPDLLGATSSSQPSAAAIQSAARNEASHFVTVAGAYMINGYLRPVLDLESGGLGSDSAAPNDGLTKSNMSVWANAFLDEVQRLKGVLPIVYANTYYATSFIDSTVAARTALWVANYNSGNQYGDPLTTGSPPTGSWGSSGQTWSFWQYSADGNGKGPTYGATSADIDLDVFRGDLTALRAFVVPEPTSCGLAGLAAGAFLGARRRRLSATQARA
ncbi:MAG: glycoside hydrolase family 25 [Phycisphaerales bacterium]|nr:glycoside hydrolase family 25 [Phycisphaerales bacterium]